MQSIDFEYDGRKLSEMGYIVCDFNFSDSSSVGNDGVEIKFETIPFEYGRINYLVSTMYESCVTTDFDICKDPELYDPLEREISREEFIELKRWLNRHEFKKFYFIHDDGQAYYFNASFNVNAIYVGGKIVGLELRMVTDSPYAYGDEITNAITFTASKNTEIINELSEEIGLICPAVEINCQSDGDLILSNETFGITTSVKNCKNGEKITFSGNTRIIETSSSGHTTLPDDFNYKFFKIGNSFESRENEITCNLPCTVTLKYNPRIKAVF